MMDHDREQTQQAAVVDLEKTVAAPEQNAGSGSARSEWAVAPLAGRAGVGMVDVETAVQPAVQDVATAAFARSVVYQ